MRQGTDAGRKSVKYFAEQTVELRARLDEIEEILHQKCQEIPYVENLLEIRGLERTSWLGYWRTTNYREAAGQGPEEGTCKRWRRRYGISTNRQEEPWWSCAH